MLASLADVARLNVLLELFSDVASSPDLETLLRVVSGRLNWVVDFDRCAFVIARPEGSICWLASKSEASVRNVPIAELSETERGIVERVLGSGAPAALALGRICVPLQGGGQTLGAISFSLDAGAYTYRDLRLGNHVGQYLGSLLSRLDLEEETRRLAARKDDLLALLSHELRNPLAPIVAAVRLLKMRANGQPSGELDIIERQAHHLVRLVDDLLDVARLTRGKVGLRCAPVGMANVIARAVEMMRPLVDERHHALLVEVANVGLVVDGDENRLAQVVSNLLSNAAHYTPSGGHIAVVVRRDGETVVIAVSDDGVGIAPEALSRIFELFVQGSNRSSGEGGLGLGLVVVKEVVELHGGTVSVANGVAGRGTTFTVRLPALPLNTVSSAPPPLADVAATTARRVLMVDDNEDALGLLSEFVSQAGHEVVTAGSGREALAALAGFPASVALIDINMPGMNGYELAAQIRSSHPIDRPYLVALTGYGQPSDRARSAAAGFDEHLVKPIDLDELLRVIGTTRSGQPFASSEATAWRSAETDADRR